MERQQKPELISGIFPKDLESTEIKNEISELIKLEYKINRNDLVYESSKQVYDFIRFQTIRSFGDSIFTGKITLSEADKKQSNLLDDISNFNNKVRPGSKAEKD